MEIALVSFDYAPIEMDLKPYVIETSLVCLNRLGLSPTNKSFWKKIIAVCTRLTGLILFVLCLLNFVFNDVNKYTFPKMLEGQISMGQVLIRNILLCFNKSKFLGVLEERSRFWPTEGLPLTLIEELRRSLKITNFAYKTFYIFGWCSTFLFIFAPLYFNELQFDCWNPENTILNFKTIATLQAILVYSTIYLVVGFDSLYMALTVNVINQFKILRYHMGNIDWTCRERIRKIIGHHVFLIDFTRQLVEMYSVLFFTQLFVATLTLVLEIHNSTDSDVQMVLLMRNTAYNVCLLIQLIFYFVPASEITYQSEEISHAIYNNGWLFAMDKDVKIDALMIMRRAQKPLLFTAMGLVPINMETFTAVFKTGMSCLTMMRHLRSG